MTVTGTEQAPLAIVLPHSESFQHAGAGAISICVRDTLAASALENRIRVLGEAVADPFDAARFIPVKPAPWWYGRRGDRYVQGVIRVLRELAPAYIEVHNRPVYVGALRKAFPDTPLLLYIHNDPRTIRGIRDVADRGRCLEQVSIVVCVSQYIRRCMLEGLEGHPDARKVRVVLNGVDTATFIPAEHKQREIVYVGRLSPQKGGLVFAQAALQLKDRLPDWRFVMVGARRFAKPTLGSDYERQTVAIMEQLGPQGVITGYVAQTKVREWFRRAAIAVIPSQWDEPLGLVVSEAMSSGCAVLASRRGGIPELIGDAGVLIGGEGKEHDAAVWSEQLLCLAYDFELQHHYQKAARDRTVQLLDIRHTSAQLDTLRREMMEESPE